MNKIQELYERQGFVLAAQVPEVAGCTSITSKGEHPTLVLLTWECARLGCDIHFFANPLDLPVSADRATAVKVAFIEHFTADGDDSFRTETLRHLAGMPKGSWSECIARINTDFARYKHVCQERNEARRALVNAVDGPWMWNGNISGLGGVATEFETALYGPKPWHDDALVSLTMGQLRELLDECGVADQLRARVEVNTVHFDVEQDSAPVFDRDRAIRDRECIDQLRDFHKLGVVEPPEVALDPDRLAHMVLRSYLIDADPHASNGHADTLSDLADVATIRALVYIAHNAKHRQDAVHEMAQQRDKWRAYAAAADAQVAASQSRTPLYSVREAIRDAGLPDWEMGKGLSSADAIRELARQRDDAQRQLGELATVIVHEYRNAIMPIRHAVRHGAGAMQQLGDSLKRLDKLMSDHVVPATKGESVKPTLDAALADVLEMAALELTLQNSDYNHFTPKGLIEALWSVSGREFTVGDCPNKWGPRLGASVRRLCGDESTWPAEVRQTVMLVPALNSMVQADSAPAHPIWTREDAAARRAQLERELAGDTEMSGYDEASARAFVSYVEATRDLLAVGTQDDTGEADRLRDAMDLYWELMSPETLDLAKWVSAHLDAQDKSDEPHDPQLPEGWSWLSDNGCVAIGPNDRRVWVHDHVARGKVPHVEFSAGRDAEPAEVVEAVLARWRGQEVESIAALLERVREAVSDPQAHTAVVLPNDDNPGSWLVCSQVTVIAGLDLPEMLRRFHAGETSSGTTYGHGATEREALHDALDNVRFTEAVREIMDASNDGPWPDTMAVPDTPAGRAAAATIQAMNDERRDATRSENGMPSWTITTDAKAPTETTALQARNDERARLHPGVPPSSILPPEGGYMRLRYPADWPRCPGCGDPALDGHVTCGDVRCDEAGHR
jgi:hypothetical protein